MQRWLLGAAMLLSATANAQATREEARQACERNDPTAMEARIDGCSWLLRSGQEGVNDQVRALVQRGNARAITGQREAGVADFGEAIRLDPRSVAALYSRANSLMALGERPGAIADFEAVMRLNKAFWQALTGRGSAYLAQGELRRAMEDFDQALQIAPGDSLTLTFRCIARARLRQPAALDDCAAATAAAAPRDGWPLAVTAGLTMLGGQTTGARAQLDQAVQRAPQAAAILHLRAILRQRLGDGPGSAADAAAASRLSARVGQNIADTFGSGLVLR